jgi:hypothetical protein
MQAPHATIKLLFSNTLSWVTLPVELFKTAHNLNIKVDMLQARAVDEGLQAPLLYWQTQGTLLQF